MDCFKSNSLFRRDCLQQSILFSMSSRRHLGDNTCSDSDTDDSDFLFPDPFTRDELRSGAIILHFIGIFYIFIGLAMICDDYFEPCLEVLIRRWNIAPDVAGATFLAVGTPNLNTLKWIFLY